MTLKVKQTRQQNEKIKAAVKAALADPASVKKSGLSSSYAANIRAGKPFSFEKALEIAERLGL